MLRSYTPEFGQCIASVAVTPRQAGFDGDGFYLVVKLGHCLILGRYLCLDLAWKSTLTGHAVMQSSSPKFFLPWGTSPLNALVTCGMMQLGINLHGSDICSARQTVSSFPLVNTLFIYIYIHPKSHNIIYLLFPIYDCDCLMPRPSRQNFLQRFATWLVAVTSSQRGNGSVPQGFLCLIASPAKNQNVSACENQELRPKSFSSSTSSVAWSPMWSNPKWICARLKLRAVCKTPHCNHVGELRLDFSAKSLPWKNVNWAWKSRWWPWKLREKREKKIWNSHYIWAISGISDFVFHEIHGLWMQDPPCHDSWLYPWVLYIIHKSCRHIFGAQLWVDSRSGW